MNKINVWKRYPSAVFQGRDDVNNSFKSFCVLQVNKDLDIYAKRASLVASPSVVSLRIYSGEKNVCWGSGFIMECNDQFQGTILTSASLFRVDALQNTIVDNLKVVVVLHKGIRFNGQVEACDFHFNLAIVKIQADYPLQVVRLRPVNDSMTLETNPRPFQLQQHSDESRLIPGCRLIALGRYHSDDADDKDDHSDIMVANGEFSVEECGFDCKELFKSTCRITKCGIGGPVINGNGEVVGVNFFAINFTPFLPINIVSKWWEHLKKFGEYRRPWLGMELSNLFVFELHILEDIIQKFPDVKEGVIVDEVTPNSPAGSVGVESGDIIIACDGKHVKGFLQFFDLIWDKVGKPVELVIVRYDGSHLNLSMIVADINPTQFNCWPLPIQPEYPERKMVRARKF